MKKNKMLNTPNPPITPNRPLVNKLLSYDVVIALIGSIAATKSKIIPVIKPSFNLYCRNNMDMINIAK